MLISLNVEDLNISVKGVENYVRDSKNFLEIGVEFSGGSWDKVNFKNAYFSYKEKTYNVLMENNRCKIPNEILKFPYFLLGIGGSYIEDGSEICFYTKNIKIPLTRSCYNEICENSDITPTISEQLFSKLNEIVEYYKGEFTKYEIIDCESREDLFPVDVKEYCINDALPLKLFYFKNENNSEVQISGLPKQEYIEKSFIVIKINNELLFYGSDNDSYFCSSNGEEFSSWQKKISLSELNDLKDKALNGLSQFEISEDQDLSTVLFKSDNGEMLILDNEEGLLQTSYTDSNGERKWIDKFLIPKEFMSAGKLNGNAIDKKIITENHLSTDLYQKIDIASGLAQQTFIELENLRPLIFKNVVLNRGSFEPNSAFENYGYKGTVNLEGCTEAMTANVIFDFDDAASGNFHPCCNVVLNGLEIWAKEIPETDITIKLIEVREI